MEIFSTSLAFVRGNYRWAQSFVLFFELRLNKQLSKQSRRWWFETPSRSLWHHCNVIIRPTRIVHMCVTMMQCVKPAFKNFIRFQWFRKHLRWLDDITENSQWGVCHLEDLLWQYVSRITAVMNYPCTNLLYFAGTRPCIYGLRTCWSWCFLWNQQHIDA